MKYQLFSERCSGSNYFETVLAANFPALERCCDYGFKHWITRRFLDADSFPEDLVYVLVIRNPFEWLRSMHASPWHAAHHLRGIPLSDFIRSEWQCVWDEQAGINPHDPRWMREMEFERNPLNHNARFKNVIEVRTVKYHLWRSRLASQPRLICINFDLFLKDPTAILRQVSFAIDLPLREPVMLPSGYKGRMGWRRRMLQRASMGLLAERLEKKKPPIGRRDMEFIAASLDKSQESLWGYNVERLVQDCV
jgi:hypothetical protein